MQIWVGLGNPGGKYAGNRHNIGFMAMDAIADDFNLPPAKTQFKGLTRQGLIAGQKILLLKPTTFMNESGQSVQAAMSFYKVPLENVCVFHDELDLDFGKVRLKVGGGIAGHNGLRSIKQHCGNEYRRVRIGIDHPGHKDKVHSHVLSDFRKDEINMRDDILNAFGKYADLLAGGQADLFQTRVSEYIKG
ncbi:peptidyl-tRNA hydrolase [Litorimonas taeanensis]|uniref:Peptidyl-tRNA hydrolase n=1 Tax=Litorimonas taeanensis TaxID=568099 RepID=A0A420WJN6_9PROT|nr:aminoacyl-tRNA hydrolase [Litorimonas taeanensis]RKQ71234.1 peptidyl-tRNA hydrolase [Litorimonas taeanensis]